MPQIKSNKYFASYRITVMTEHLNYSNKLYGGQLLKWIDEASGMYSACQMDTPRLVTLKVSEMFFKKPGLLGDLLVFYVRTIKEGNTSITVQVRVITKDIGDKPSREICNCEVIYVAVDELGRPTPWVKTKKRHDWKKTNFTLLPE